MLALAIFLGTYTILALGRVPRLRIDRTGAAIIGAALMIGSGTLTFDEAMHAVDHETLVLLFGMMIVVANLRLSGFFTMGGRLGGPACPPSTHPARRDCRSWPASFPPSSSTTRCAWC